MAAVSLETTELETLVESALNNKTTGMDLLNALRVKNGKLAHPANYGPGDVNNVHPGLVASALAGVEADLAV
ncbi:hypothetical protein GR925_19255 [Streptomyces sp. HUCO-GS316]|uniref:hypothetical protein n=1 Tax=Streptomyces sp. HUCO-GS316 TaxID=2692198 RepID=UPI001372122D|nr:hypothetical protein [Streptomyces sp. HUCO-GS316]MXM65532.1 hypothetical protein [Streptomyces sp. HUCO-GS316]